MGDSQTPAALNEAMVEALKQLQPMSPPIEAAFRAVPRHFFLPGAPPEVVYANEAVPVKRGADGLVISSISQPTMIAMMLEQLDLRPGDNVLEIGAGTGYNAALMQHIVGDTGKVTAIELDKDLVRQATDNLQRLSLGSKVNIVHADGAAGYAPRASYDRIIATVGIWDVPQPWTQQLKFGGVLVAPLWLDSMQMCGAFRLNRDETLYSANNIPCGFVQLRGPAAGPVVSKRLGSSSLMLVSNRIHELDVASLHLLMSDDHEDMHFGEAPLAGEYWNGFLPYLTLNIPPGFIFAQYYLLGNSPAYGLESNGFALLTQGSACFVPYSGEGKALVIAGADAFLALQASLTAWRADGAPKIHQLRLRLHPIARGKPEITTGLLYERSQHFLHVWHDKDGEA